MKALERILLKFHKDRVFFVRCKKPYFLMNFILGQGYDKRIRPSGKNFTGRIHPHNTHP